MLTILLLLLLSILNNTQAENVTFNLNILHINDFHARFEETNYVGGVCKSDKCIGGFSRLYNAISTEIKHNPDSIILNAGDNFQGTLWYNLFKWNVTQHFMNQIPFDAITLGNHEFDDGIEGVTPFLKNLNAPVVVANMDDHLEPSIQNTYKKSVIVVRDGKKIGIIGVLIKTAHEIANTGKLTFSDESEAVNAEAERLAKEENVFTNIVLSHCGYEIEKEIARKATAASKISLIVGGHSHTFLYTGIPVPGPLTPTGDYPTIVNRQEDEKNVLVVQASAYCRYLGNIQLSFDENGNCIEWSGLPIFLDTSMPQDEEINKNLQPWKEEIDAYGKTVIGRTFVQLEQNNCRYSECLLGNFVTDVMVYAYTDLSDESSWTYASMAITNAGGLRTSIPQGEITYNDMVTAQPFENTFDVGEIDGKYIKELFEFSMTPYNYGRSIVNVNLLQISGIQLVANLSQPIGSRVQSIKLRCNECKVPIYEDLDFDKTYRLIVPSFLVRGGDGFVILSKNLKNLKTGKLDMDVFVDFLERKSPFLAEIEGRIKFVGDEKILYQNLEPQF